MTNSLRFKQMQDLADGKPEMVTSHSGVLFLLEDMGVKLPRLYQQSNMPTPAPAPVPVPMPTMTPPAPLKVSAPDSQSVRPNADLEGPLLFSDPVLPDEVRDFFCITKPSEHPPAQNKQQADPPAYDPFVDDLAVFKRELLSQPETVHVPVREEEHRVNVCEHEKEIYDLANDVSLTREYGGTMLGYLPVAVMLHDQDKRA